ncbi:hypothetical protein KC19_9G137600 [Ceratodon purpureus]|uniref:Ankyrin repeat protein n=1 Tax=Ceratodon purpureus TaxID=3225 RepID=A0A8T0GVG5_CERPU|nr:hypothetical protein KC19_9G137600 [Ceratodon purpureus]
MNSLVRQILSLESHVIAAAVHFLMARALAMVEACEGACRRRRQEPVQLLRNAGVTERDLNYALLQAASLGNEEFLQTLIEAGATNISSASACAGYSGHRHIVDALLPRARSVVIGAAFVGSLVGLRKDLLDHVVHMADLEGLDRCLLLGAARIWSCKSTKETEFLSGAIGELAKAGARSFQTAVQVTCGDALIRYWNKHVFEDKIKVLENLITLGSRYLAGEFMGKISLMVCVTLYTKVTKLQEKKRVSSYPGRKIWQHKSGDCFVPDVQDMMEILLVVCRCGAVYRGLTDRPEVLHSKSKCIMSLLHAANCSYQFGEGKCDSVTCKVDWPLRMLKFLLVECGVRRLSFSVTTLAVYQAARSNVLRPVVQCLVEEKCFEAAYVYLDMAVTFCQGDAIEYLLNALPRPRDVVCMVNAVRCAASTFRGPPRGPQGVLLALHANFLDDPVTTLREAEVLAGLPKTDPIVKMRLKQEWSQQAFEEGVAAGHAHYMTWMLLRKNSDSGFKELPTELQVAIAYLPLYKACCQAPGSLLSQRQRGELTTAVSHLFRGSGKLTDAQVFQADKPTLLGFLAVCLPDWCQEVVAVDSTASSFCTFGVKQ